MFLALGTPPFLHFRTFRFLNREILIILYGEDVFSVYLLFIRHKVGVNFHSVLIVFTFLLMFLLIVNILKFFAGRLLKKGMFLCPKHV
jgi:hypothetical protein